MIDTNNIPGGRQEATVAYSAIKTQFEDMAAKMATGDLSHMSELEAYT